MQTFFKILIFISIITSLKSTCIPEQIHLSLSDAFTNYTDDSSPMRVIFTTKGPCESAYVSLTTPEGIQNVSAADQKCNERNYDGVIYINCIHVFDFPATLNFSQSYGYSCYGDSESAENVGPFKFYIPSPKYQEGQETNVVIFADMDATEFGMTTINRLTKIAQKNFSKIDAFFHNGDIAYNLGGNASAKGDNFLNTIQNFTAIMPYMVTAGNHENSSNFSNFNMRFRMPLYKETKNHYYSFAIGNIHFVSFNLDFLLTNTDPALRQYMLDWLDQDLQSVNRQEKPWIVAVTHRPFYCSFKKSDDCTIYSQRWADFEVILLKYKVDLVLGGHVHIYERMLPIKKGHIGSFVHRYWDDKYRYIINPQTPMYVVQGMAGHKGDEADPQDVYKGQSFAVKVSKDYSFLKVRSLNSTYLKVENYESKSGKINDEFYIIRTEYPKSPRLPRYESETKENVLKRFFSDVFTAIWKRLF